MQTVARKDDILTKLSEVELFRRVQAGDDEAFTVIYYRYAPTLHQFAQAYLVDEDAAKDAVQNVFVRLWERRQTIIITSSLKNYLYTAMKNHVLNCLRNRLAVVENSPVVAPLYIDIEAEMERNEIRTLLDKAVDDVLNNVKRTIVRLRWNGLSNREVAEHLSMPENTVKTYYAQSIVTLRTYMQRLLVPILLIICLFK